MPSLNAQTPNWMEVWYFDNLVLRLGDGYHEKQMHALIDVLQTPKNVSDSDYNYNNSPAASAAVQS